MTIFSTLFLLPADICRMLGPENILCKLLRPDQDRKLAEDRKLAGSDLDPTFFSHFNSVAERNYLKSIGPVKQKNLA